MVSILGCEPFSKLERGFISKIKGIQQGIWTAIDFAQFNFELVDL